MSSSQLTNSYFTEGFFPNHQPDSICMINSPNFFTSTVSISMGECPKTLWRKHPISIQELVEIHMFYLNKTCDLNCIFFMAQISAPWNPILMAEIQQVSLGTPPFLQFSWAKSQVSWMKSRISLGKSPWYARVVLRLLHRSIGVGCAFSGRQGGFSHVDTTVDHDLLHTTENYWFKMEKTDLPMIWIHDSIHGEFSSNFGHGKIMGRCPCLDKWWLFWHVSPGRVEDFNSSTLEIRFHYHNGWITKRQGIDSVEFLCINKGRFTIIHSILFGLVTKFVTPQSMAVFSNNAVVGWTISRLIKWQKWRLWATHRKSYFLWTSGKSSSLANNIPMENHEFNR